MDHDRRPLRPRLACALALAGALLAAAPARAAYDPATTATIYVHGFDVAGADRSGVYGDELHEAVADSIAALAGLPASHGGVGALPPNVVIGVGYYGDTAPAWMSAAERATIDSITAVWGGGVPRYAAIVATFARHVIERSDARQVNFVSASFGSLVVRWLIERDAGGLAGDGRIARWLSVEGLLGGSWPASHAPSILGAFGLAPIDVEHMTHDWVDAHLHLPHDEADSPRYANVLLGALASTDETYQDHALSAAMLAGRDWQPNDGVQAMPDAVFRSVTAPSRLLGLPPTRAVFHATHFGLAGVHGAWAEAATFLTQRRRVTVTWIDATVTKLHEPDLPYWDWRPAEVVFESAAYSPAVAARWGIGEPLSRLGAAGAAAPLRRFDRAGVTLALGQLAYDGFVLPEETVLRLDLHASEVDNDARYGVFETAAAPYLDDMAGGALTVSTLAAGTYTFATPDWSARLSVTVTDYPFAAPLSAPAAAPSVMARLSLAPNPARGAQRITLAGSAGPVRIEVVDVAGRTVRRALAAGGAGVWDGRDDAGRAALPGVYLVRAITPRGTVTARSLRVR